MIFLDVGELEEEFVVLRLVSVDIRRKFANLCRQD